MTAAAALAPLLLLAMLMLAGRPLVERLPGSRPLRSAYAVLAGLWLLHLLLTLLDLARVRWSVPLVAGALLLFALWRLRERMPAAPSPRPAWGDGVALLATLAFAALAATRWIAFSDFVYHWGLKGHRFLLARRVDYDFLAQPWNWVLHPDYPNLYPELLAVTAMLGGGWQEAPLMLWSPILMALLLVVARETLAPGELGPRAPGLGDPWVRNAVLATLGCALAAFGIGHLMAGAADWFVALALLAALPPLVRPADAAGDLQLGLCAAVAAAAKAEGIALAGFLVAVQLARHLLAMRRSGTAWRSRAAWRTALAGFAMLLLPPASVVLPWWLRVAHHGLFQLMNSGPPELGRVRVVARAVAQSMTVAAWGGLTLALLLVPLLLARRGPLRPFATVVALQALLYGWQYLTAPVDTGFLVLSTFPRLALHLLPSVMVAAALAWLGGTAPGAARARRRRDAAPA